MRNLRLPTRLLPLGLLGVAGLALAGTWSDFKAAFPSQPCQDGWSGCIVDGTPVSPGMVLDAKGRPHPADMRLGFFDFDPLPSLSPFAPLSNYTGDGVQGIDDGDASADAANTNTGPGRREGRPQPVVDSAAQRRASEERATAKRAVAAERAAQESSAAASREAQQRAQAETQARAAQETARKAAEQADADAASAKDAAARAKAQQRADEARQVADDAARKAEAERVAAETARKLAEVEAKKQAAAEEARRVAEAESKRASEAAAAEAAARAKADAAAAAQAAKAEQAAAAAAAPAAKTATPVSAAADGAAVAMTQTPSSSTPSSSGGSMAPATCDNLVALEVPAMMGQLGAGVRGCLEKSLGGAASQTGKDKISRVLIADAEARRDQKDWEKLMKRHLEDIDRSDPNLCFKYALHLSRGGASRAFGVIRWADYALENKQQWSGASYTKNVAGLYKIRAQAANKLWQNAENKLVEDRSDENEAASEKYRGQTKGYAREWLDYARASGQQTSTAMALCVSAAGNKDFCGG